MDEYGEAVDDYRDIGNRRMDNAIHQKTVKKPETFGSGYEVPVYIRDRSQENQENVFGFNSFGSSNRRGDSDDIFGFDIVDSEQRELIFGQGDLFNDHRHYADIRENDRVSYDYYGGKPVHFNFYEHLQILL